MGLFKKKEEKEKEDSTKNELPKLPDLPELPELPETNNKEETSELPELPETYSTKDKIPQLPSFPNDDMGNKFSQDTIKEAITGKKGVQEIYANDFDNEEETVQMMQKSRISEEESERTLPKFSAVKETEPIFIRIDKFEEGSKTFEEVKKKLSEIEKMFIGVKRVKEEEDKELASWEREINQIKSKIEKIDNNIFSKF